VGFVMKKHMQIRQVSPGAIEDIWQRRATAAAIASARKIVSDGTIPPGTQIARLGDGEWGWLVAAILFGWIATRAEQATAENLDTEQTVRMTTIDPQPWDMGAVMSILPDLATEMSDVDWSQPIGAWPRETMAEFLLVAMRLIRQAMIARDSGERGITKESRKAIIHEDGWERDGDDVPF
jgi:hypothetical protein